MTVKKIAIACQGGGTHAAFAWGVLREILETKRNWDAEAGDATRFDIVGMSGTSAGAFCALAAWYGLVPNTADSECGTIDKSIERLDYLWAAFSANTAIEQTHNMAVSALLELKEQGVPFPDSSPYEIYSDLALTTLSLLGAREQYLSFPSLLSSLCPDFESIDWRAFAKANCRLLAGAIEIYSGNFEIFDSDKTLEDMNLRPPHKESDKKSFRRWRTRRPISLEGVAASGTLPEVLPAQCIEGQTFPTGHPGESVQRDAHYWDGMYSQNPPVRLFLDRVKPEEKPDEIWVIRINPQEIDSQQALTRLEDIRNRESDLAGNLSLNQELDHILSINEWLESEAKDASSLRNRTFVDIRTIKMTRETAWGLRRTLKFDRNPIRLRELHAEGRHVAEHWLADWRTQGEHFAAYPDDARYID